MANVLKDEKKQQIIALGRLGWSLRKIQEATRVRRETISAYLRGAGVEIWPSGRWKREGKRRWDPITCDSPLGWLLETDFGRALQKPDSGQSLGRKKAKAFSQRSQVVRTEVVMALNTYRVNQFTPACIFGEENSLMAFDVDFKQTDPIPFQHPK
jgi:hypothetical protein